MDNPEKELQNKAEAVLFAAARKISLDEMSRLCKDSPKNVKDAIEVVKQKLKDTESPLLVVEESDGYKMVVRENYLSYVKQIVPATELGKSILETLAIIAWKQPINQSEVVKIRSSKAYDHIAELEELGFVHREKKGRSFIIKTTQKFADYFDLPTKEEIKKLMKPAVDAMTERMEQGEALKEKIEGLETYYEGQAGSQNPKLNGYEVFEEGEELKKSKPAEQAEEGQNQEEQPEEAQEQGWAQEEETEEQPKEEEPEEIEEKQRKAIYKGKGQASDEEEEPEEESEEEPEEAEGEFSLKKIKESARKEFEQETQERKPKVQSEDEKNKDEIKIEEKGRKINEKLEKMLEINKGEYNKLKGEEKEEEYKPEEEEEPEEDK